jgi:hypothetical protein
MEGMVDPIGLLICVDGGYDNLQHRCVGYVQIKEHTFHVIQS